jgi:hypothetical protein
MGGLAFYRRHRRAINSTFMGDPIARSQMG